jgi:hypothetical protein
LAQSRSGKFAAPFSRFGLGKQGMFRLFLNLWLLPRLVPGCLFWLLLLGLALSYCDEQKPRENRPPDFQEQNVLKIKGVHNKVLTYDFFRFVSGAHQG